MILQDFFKQLDNKPESVEFSDTLAVIDANYQFTPSQFDNGDVVNAIGQNSGSCKVFAFGLLHQLSEAQTLACFGQYYWDDVLNNPSADNHANIRSFMKNGWSGIRFFDVSNVLKKV